MADIDGLFFNMADDSKLEGLNVYPDTDTGPVIGHQVLANGVDTLANGASVPESFDAAVQFGQVPGSTEGQVNGANFTLWSDNGPLTLDDIDLSRMSLIVDSDGPNPQILTGGVTAAAADEDPDGLAGEQADPAAMAAETADADTPDQAQDDALPPFTAMDDYEDRLSEEDILTLMTESATAGWAGTGPLDVDEDELADFL